MFDACMYTGRAMGEGNKWYFYSRRTASRITSNGYWKALGGDEPIFSTSGSHRVGIKKYYAFYIGEPPQGDKTNWVMQEYRLSAPADSASASTSSAKSSSRRRSHSKNVSIYVYVCIYTILKTQFN